MMRAICAVLVFLAVEIAWYTQWRENEKLRFLPIIAPLVLISPALRALRRQFTKTTISGDRLRYEAGAFRQIHPHHATLQAPGCPRGPERDPAHVRCRQPVPRDLRRNQPADDRERGQSAGPGRRNSEPLARQGTAV